MKKNKNNVPERYDYRLKDSQRGASGEGGIISLALTSGISAYREPTLFDILDEEERNIIKAADEKHLIDRRGKPIYLTLRQNKIIYGLSMYMSVNREDEEIRKYVEALQTGRQPKTRITLPISVTQLTKLIELDGKARARQKEKVLEELKTLSEVRQVQTFTAGTEDKKIRFSAPLIQIGEQIEDLSKDKELNADFVNVIFGSIFFKELYNKYAVIKPELFRIWGKSGSGTDTELFRILLADLLSKYSGHKIAARKAKAELKRKEYATEEDYTSAVEKAQEEALTYSEYSINLRNRITTDYESTRKQRNDFKIHLKAAIVALQKIGLLKAARFVNTDRGERVDYIFNFDYDKRERESTLLLS